MEVPFPKGTAMTEPEHVADTPLAAELLMVSGMAALAAAELEAIAALHRRYARDRAIVASLELRQVEPMVTFAPPASAEGARDARR